MARPRPRREERNSVLKCAGDRPLSALTCAMPVVPASSGLQPTSKHAWSRNQSLNYVYVVWERWRAGEHQWYLPRQDLTESALVPAWPPQSVGRGLARRANACVHRAAWLHENAPEQAAGSARCCRETTTCTHYKCCGPSGAQAGCSCLQRRDGTKHAHAADQRPGPVSRGHASQGS